MILYLMEVVWWLMAQVVCLYLANSGDHLTCFPCQVLYVDFGNRDTVKTSKLVDVAPLLEVPIQAFAVRLANMVSLVPLSLCPTPTLMA